MSLSRFALPLAVASALLATSARADLVSDLGSAQLSCGYEQLFLSKDGTLRHMDPDNPGKGVAVRLKRGAAAKVTFRNDKRWWGAERPAIWALTKRGKAVALVFPDGSSESCVVTGGAKAMAESQGAYAVSEICGNDPAPACVRVLTRGCGKAPDPACAKRLAARAKAAIR